MSDPAWYQSSVFYEVPIRAFYDSDGDGCARREGTPTGISPLLHIA